MEGQGPNDDDIFNKEVQQQAATYEAIYWTEDMLKGLKQIQAIKHMNFQNCEDYLAYEQETINSIGLHRNIIQIENESFEYLNQYFIVTKQAIGGRIEDFLNNLSRITRNNEKWCRYFF